MARPLETIPNLVLRETTNFAVSQSWFLHDLQMQKKALEKPEGYEFEAQLPEIVGYVPEDERPYFDNLPAEALVASHNSWKCLPKELRGLERIIKDDYDQFNLSGHGSFMHIELERKTTSPGFFARPPGYHTDGVLNRLNINSLRYIVANRCTTIFYGGIARYESDKLGMIAIDPASLDQSKPCISAPFYGIVRLSGATIHASPKFEEEQERTFGWITFLNPYDSRS